MNKYVTKFTRNTLFALSGLILCSQAYADLDAIQKTGTLKVAVYEDFAPFSNGRKGDSGIDFDIANALARQLNLKLSLLPFDSGENVNDDLRNMVWKGHYLGYGPADVMLHVPIDNWLTNGNPQVSIFGPYYREQIILGVNSDKMPVTSNLSDLADKKLCAVKGDAGAQILFSASNGALINQVHLVDNVEECASLMVKGDVDAIAARRAELESTLYSFAALKLVPIESNVIPNKGWMIGMAIKKENPNLGEALARALDAIRTSGELHDIFAKHHVIYVSP